MKNKNYSFKNNIRCDVTSLIQAINTLGDDLVGCELGVEKGKSSFTILDNCSIKRLYLIDNWEPYVDYIASGKSEPNKPFYGVDEKEQDLNEMTFHHFLKYSSSKDKVVILKKDSKQAVLDIPDQSLDFIFFDAMLTKEQSFEEAYLYYPKIKKGGLFTGHDANSITQVLKPVQKIKEMYGNHNKIKIYNDTFLFRI